jgi:DNA-binding transcriptional MocR family regulator
MWPVPERRLAAALADVREQRGPLYAALADRLRLLVGDGRLPVGTRLPSERDLAAATGLSRATVTSAYRLLVDTGWAQARRGAGTWTRLPAEARGGGAWVPAPAEAGVYDLAHAAPPAPPQVHAAFAAALDDLPAHLPGHGYVPGGLPELRARVAARYTARGLPTDPEQVVVTAGALHAVAVALRVLAAPGDRVLVEHPSYPNALDAVTAAGAEPVPLPLEAEQPAAYAHDLHRLARQTAPRAAYLMPDFQNPTGLLATTDTRRRVAASLQQAGTVAIVDETLAELGLDTPAPEPFAVHARPESVVTVGSLSKCVWGGLRLGWLRADHDTARRLASAAARDQLSGPVLEQLAGCHLLDALDDVLGVHRPRLREQRDALLSAMTRRLPAWDVRRPEGGLVLWCRLPAAVSSALATTAENHGLRLAAGPRFGVGPAFEDRLRLPFTQPVDVLEPAVDLLAALVPLVSPQEPTQATTPQARALVV